MNTSVRICVLAIALSSLVESSLRAQEFDVSPLTIGESVVFNSSILNEERKLNVYLPLSYSKNPERKYPVIYLLDGSLDEDFLHIAGLTQFASFSWIKILPETIVVGIANVDRKRDFTSSTTNEKYTANFPTAGGSAKFIKVLTEEIRPLVEKRYRSNGKRTVIGQSLGGLLATEILLQKPESFDNYILISPSLWWDDRSLLALPLPKFKKPVSIFVGVGKEGEEMEELAKDLFAKLGKNRSNDFHVDFKFFPKKDHGDTLHLAVYEAFEKMFSAQKKDK